jgi:hypothetical protein
MGRPASGLERIRRDLVRLTAPPKPVPEYIIWRNVKKDYICEIRATYSAGKTSPATEPFEEECCGWKIRQACLPNDFRKIYAGIREDTHLHR